MFEIVDDRTWARLDPDTGSTELTLKAKGTKGAYDVVEFRAELPDESPANTFLYKHGLTWKWRIEIDADGGVPRGPLEPVTGEPYVSQFIPAPNAVVTVAVEVRYPRRQDKIDLSRLEFETTRSTAFGFASRFSPSEAFALALVFVLAALAGVQADVFSSAGTGSWLTYVPLFAWGFAADQTKNLLQNLSTFLPNR